MNKSVNTIRMLSVDMINNAKSGHPGAPLGFAPIAYTLFHDFLKITPKNSSWFDRDRFVLASGHASSMLYSLLHLCGYKVTIEDLKSFRQLGSVTPGHPELGITDGVDCSSGPLGQGIAEACGMAIAEKFLAAKFNKEDIKLIDHYTFVECGDGDLQEGVTLEALSIIGRLKLNKLIILYDSNKVQLDGPVANAGGIPNSKQYFESLGFNYLEVNNAEDINEIAQAINSAKNSSLPSMIECHTVIGYGSPLQNSNKSHGSPLGEENTVSLRKVLGYELEPFKVDPEVYTDMREALKKNNALLEKWNDDLELYKEKYNDDYQEFIKVLSDDYALPADFFNDFEYKSEASRQTIGKLINKVSEYHKTFFAGSADLTASTQVKGIDGSFDIENPLGRNINFGVREHAMGAIANGLTLCHLRIMTGAFFVFSDYMKPAIRLAALMHLPTIFVFTHDSIAVGEDGPTHEPIEQLASLRSIPNVQVLRPSDAYTTAKAVELAFETKDKPTVLVLTRQNLNLLDNVDLEEVRTGAILRKSSENPVFTLVASGSEVALALDAAKELDLIDITTNVVEIISTNLFDKLDNVSMEELIPSDIPSMFIEMASPFGLTKYANYVYALDRFGESAPQNVVIPYLGFTKEKIVEAVKKIVNE